VALIRLRLGVLDYALQPIHLALQPRHGRLISRIGRFFTHQGQDPDNALQELLLFRGVAGLMRLLGLGQRGA
jgi:hypothetical protein